MPPTPRPTLLRTWPAFAAAIATFAGMTSCVATVMPLTMFGAPLLGLGIVALLFSFLLALSPAAPNEREQRDRVHFAAAIAWMVSVGTCWRFATQVNALSRGGGSYDNTTVNISIFSGVVLGIAIAMLVARIGMAQYRRHLAMPDGGTLAQRMGLERLVASQPAAASASPGTIATLHSAAGWVVAMVIGGYAGRLLATYWTFIGLAPRNAYSRPIGTVIGALLGAAATYIVRHLPMEPSTSPVRPPSVH
jgi:hypothetical protein